MRERRLRHTVIIDFVKVEDTSDLYVFAETICEEKGLKSIPRRRFYDLASE
jgi:hypothetical protein